MSNLVLIGLRGSGKTTIGRLVAAGLGSRFVDLDEMTPREMGCATVAEAWERGGEAAFRAAEAAALKKALAVEGQVIALGGGTPTAPGAADVLRERRDKGGVVIIYLRASPEVLRERLASSDNSHRPPLLKGSTDPLAEIDRVHAQRDPAYRTLASLVIEVGGIPLNEAVGRVIAAAGC